MKIELRDPRSKSLRRSALHAAHVPEPNKSSPEWIAFVETVRNDGRIRDAVKGNAAGLVFDGWWRIEAARDLQLCELPYEVHSDAEEALLIVESLTARKHMQVSGRVYLALGILPQYARAAECRRLRNEAQSRKTAEEPLDPKVISTDHPQKPGSLRHLSSRFGCSPGTIHKAKELRSFFHDLKFFAAWLKKNGVKVAVEQHSQMQADLRGEFEPLLFNATKSLWDVLQAVAGRLTGKRKEPQVEQLEFVLDSAREMQKHLQKLNEHGRAAVAKELPKLLAESPEVLDLLEAACAKAREKLTD